MSDTGQGNCGACAVTCDECATEFERDQLRREVERLREALRWIATYGENDGDVLKDHDVPRRWVTVMRNIAGNTLRERHGG